MRGIQREELRGGGGFYYGLDLILDSLILRESSIKSGDFQNMMHLKIVNTPVVNNPNANKPTKAKGCQFKILSTGGWLSFKTKAYNCRPTIKRMSILCK